MDSKRGHFRAKIARDARGRMAMENTLVGGGTTIAAKMGVKRGLDAARSAGGSFAGREIAPRTLYSL